MVWPEVFARARATEAGMEPVANKKLFRWISGMLSVNPQNRLLALKEGFGFL